MAEPAHARQANIARTEFFHQIKPCCVSISKTASKSTQTATDSRHLITLVQELWGHLSAQVNHDPTIFDKNLADYIFFPLAFIFKNQEQHPLSLIEITLRCLKTLIFHGWHSNIEPELVQQLMVFLTFIIAGVPTQKEKRDISEEVVLYSLSALDTLITVAGNSVAASSSLVDAANIPALGHAITILLDCIVDGKTPEVQIEAMTTLKSLFTCIKDNAALASFLPGTVSTLTKVLAAPAREKRKVLVGAIQALKVVITRVLGDIHTRILLRQMEAEKNAKESLLEPQSTAVEAKEVQLDSESTETSKVNPEDKKSQILSPAWLRATAAQIKLALATIMKLTKSDEQEVRKTLERLCISLLDECHKSLECCAPLLVEAAMTLSDDEEEQDYMITGLSDLALVYSELSDSIKNTVYSWVSNLPQVMQSADESVKQRAISNVKKGLRFASTMNFASPTLDDAVSAALRDSIAQIMLNSKSPKVIDEVETMELLSGKTEMTKADGQLVQFRPVLMSHESQTKFRSEVINLVEKLATASQQAKFATEMMEYTQGSTNEAQVSAFWLSFHLLKSALSRNSEFDAFIAFDSSSEAETAFNDLYAYSVSVLHSRSEFVESDWRLEALAIETVAFAASRSKEDFRLELIDVLFPVTSLLVSENVQLRHHAIVGLNSIAMACGYSSVSEILIQNADYMVNSVSLRFNSLNVTPTTNKVLQMVIRLAGPRIVPYLEDVVGSIFGALDNYHGYPVFVEGLFAVLNEIVTQGVKSIQLLIGDVPQEEMPIATTKTPKTWMTIEDVRQSLIKREERWKQRLKEDKEFDRNHKPYPERPWKSDLHKKNSRVTDIIEGKDENDDMEDVGRKLGEEDEDVEPPKESEKPPPTPTYSILSKITELTQHYLTSPTPTLRRLLLTLLSTVVPALANDPGTFLPLVNTVWPVIIQRLYDSEPFISTAACDTMIVLCASAGDFMTSRFKDEWNARMFSWAQKIKKEATGGFTKKKVQTIPSNGVDIFVPTADGRDSIKISSKKIYTTEVAAVQVSSNSLGQYAQAAKMWEAATQLIVAILKHVGVEDEMYDQMLELLGDQLHREDVRSAFETINPDAVWLALLLRGKISTEGLVPPEMEGVSWAPLPVA